MPVDAMTTGPAPKPDPWDFETLLTIDKRIDTREDENVRDCWEFGRVMLAARAGKKRLANGYLAELVKVTGKSQRELSNRLRCADVYPTEVELCNALQSCSSWHEMAENLYAEPDAEPTPDVPQPKPQPTSPDSGPPPTPKHDDTAKKKPKGQARVEANDEVPPIDWASIPVTSQKKINAEVRRYIREVKAEFESLVQAEVERREDAAYRWIRERAQRIENFGYAQRSGVITEADYDLIRRCMHPDTANVKCDDQECGCHKIKHIVDRSVSVEMLNKAFRLWDDAKTKMRFIPPERARLDGLSFEDAMEELAKRRAEKKRKDNLRREQRKQQREQQKQQQDAPPSAPQSG